MIEFVLMVVILAAAPLAAASALLIGRWSADGAARFAATLLALAWLAAVALTVLTLLPGSAGAGEAAGTLGLRVDALATMMLLLVLGLSGVIQFFAVRYLRGDARQLWFVVTANLVTASTAVLVCTNTVLGFGLAWVAVGASLVALLATYSNLPQARDGVRRTAVRFVIGDLPLAAAVALLMISAGGDLALSNLGSTIAELPTPIATLIALLLVVPALARSSQVPFHGWLPATLAAPTPVSALMHAGVVNAGALLILRFSPAVGESAIAMAVVFVAGAVTLVYASLVRLVKPDVKGRLVFSTMAQMGFMMLACGMGAFAAAVFHLIAHGLFKSALFLGAGSGVAREAGRRIWPTRQLTRWPQASAAIAVAVVVPIGAILAARAVLSIELSPASAALQLFVVFTAAIALGTTLWNRFSAATAVLGGASIVALTFGYEALISAFDSILNFGEIPGAVAAVWLIVPAAALLALMLLPRNATNSLTGRLYAVALAAGTPSVTPQGTPMRSGAAS